MTDEQSKRYVTCSDKTRLIVFPSLVNLCHMNETTCLCCVIVLCSCSIKLTKFQVVALFTREDNDLSNWNVSSQKGSCPHSLTDACKFHVVKHCAVYNMLLLTHFCDAKLNDIFNRFLL